MRSYMAYVDPDKKKFRIRFRKDEKLQTLKDPYTHKTRYWSDRGEAEKFLRTLNMTEDYKFTLTLLRETWESQFVDFKKQLPEFEKWHKKSAPLTFDRAIYNLQHYVFPFFLGVKGESNPLSWRIHFKEFKEHIEKSKTIKKNVNQTGGQTILKPASQNHVINALNLYLKFFWEMNHHQDMPPKCALHDKKKLGRRTAEDLISIDEYHAYVRGFDLLAETYKMKAETTKAERRKLTHEKQVQKIIQVKQMFIVLYHSGMRLGEVLGLAVGDFVQKELDDKKLSKMLAQHNIKSLGYIRLKSQLDNVKNGLVSRKPLKTKRTMSYEDGRYIPIVEQGCFEILKELNQKAISRSKNQTIQHLKSGQVLYFDGISKGVAYNNLVKVYEMLKEMKIVTRWKPWHCNRHSRSTELTKETFNSEIIKLILGHSSRQYETYVHLAGEILENEIDDKYILGFGEEDKISGEN
jgi:site-specific recombinase XerD